MTTDTLEAEKRFFEFIETLRTHIGMFVPSEDYSGVSSIILGYDLASGGAVLPRFKDWLVDEHATPPNLSWISAVLYLAGCETWAHVSLTQEEQVRAVSTLFSLLSEYCGMKEPPVPDVPSTVSKPLPG